MQMNPQYFSMLAVTARKVVLPGVFDDGQHTKGPLGVGQYQTQDADCLLQACLLPLEHLC